MGNSSEESKHVTIPWGSEDHLKASRECKVEKHSGTKNCLEQKGFEVLLEGFLVGSLGTWDPEYTPSWPKWGLVASTGSYSRNCALAMPFRAAMVCGLPIADVEVGALTTAPERQTQSSLH